MKKRHPRGFTLIEFLLYFALLTIVITATTIFSVDVFKSRAKAQVIAETEQNTRLSALRILRSIRQASGLNVGGSTFNDDDGVLSLAQDDPSADPTVFDISGGVLRIKEGAGAATAITSSEVEVTRLRFTKDTGHGDRVVNAELTVRYLTDNPDLTFAYTVSTTGTAVIRKQ